MRAMNKLAVAAAVATMMASVAGAQSSNTGDTGGSSFTGAVVNFTPFGRPSITIVTTTTAGVAAAGQAFRTATGATTVNSGGQTGSLPAATANAIGAVLGGAPTAAQSQAFVASLVGVSPGTAQRLATALAAVSGGGTGALTEARNAFNSAVQSLRIAGAPIPPAMIAVRSALGG